MRNLGGANSHFHGTVFAYLFVLFMFCLFSGRLSSGKGVDLPACCRVNNKKMEVLCTFL